MSVDGEEDLALVDVVLCRERWIGARALYETGAVSEVFVSCARPDAVGLSSVAGLLEPCHGSFALDGEREIELCPELRPEVWLSADGPLTVDVGECMRRVSREGLLKRRA